MEGCGVEPALEVGVERFSFFDAYAVSDVGEVEEARPELFLEEQVVGVCAEERFECGAVTPVVGVDPRCVCGDLFGG